MALEDCKTFGSVGRLHMETDVAIVGGGPGGATLGMYLAQEGIQSVIIEKETFPRYPYSVI